MQKQSALHRSLSLFVSRFSTVPPPRATPSRVSDVLAPGAIIGTRVSVHGWIRTARVQKRYGFVEINDGSCAGNLQVVWPVGGGGGVTGSEGLSGIPSALESRLFTTGASVLATGTLVKSPAAGQNVELSVDSLQLVCGSDAATYPLQKKAHTAEFLRENIHLRPRGAVAGAILRVRSSLSAALNGHLTHEGLFHVHTPILTANDCEGAGELFGVEAVRAAGAPPFFGRRVFLTVSGQLHLETFAAALSRVYSFGPTFRAENSNTPRHLAEFWMLEPEIAPARLPDAIALASSTLSAAARSILEGPCASDLDLLARENASVVPDLIARLQRAASNDFPKITYDEALVALHSTDAPSFATPVPEWGGDFSGEHERWLASHSGGPLFVTNYPATLKPFYMALNVSDTHAAVRAAALVARDPRAANAQRITVANFDLLVPGLGELAGGSARESRTGVLAVAMHARGLLTPSAALDADTAEAEARTASVATSETKTSRPPADPGDGTLDWYLDLRRYGGVQSAGFGMGFDRLVTWCTGVDNVRDAVPVPRVVGANGCRM